MTWGGVEPFALLAAMKIAVLRSIESRILASISSSADQSCSGGPDGSLTPDFSRASLAATMASTCSSSFESASA